MRKTNWLLTSLILCLGIVLGVFGYIFWGSYFQPGINQPEKTNAAEVTGIDTSQKLPVSTIQSNDVSIDSQKNNDFAQNQDLISISQTEQDQIVSDYKQAVGILFDAWKLKDISAFRSKLAGAYTGKIMEDHVSKAEKYLSNGIGLYVSSITFDSMNIESADKYSTTVNAIYRYTAQDYDLDKKFPYGEEINHFVHVRANLVKIESKWMITSETVI